MRLSIVVEPANHYVEQEVIVRNKGLASAVLITAAFPFIESNKCGTKCGGFISLMITFASYS